MLESTKEEEKKNGFPRTRNGQPLNVAMTATATVIKQILNGHFQHGHRSILIDLILLRRFTTDIVDISDVTRS